MVPQAPQKPSRQPAPRTIWLPAYSMARMMVACSGTDCRLPMMYTVTMRTAVFGTGVVLLNGVTSACSLLIGRPPAEPANVLNAVVLNHLGVPSRLGMVAIGRHDAVARRFQEHPQG